MTNYINNIEFEELVANYLEDKDNKELESEIVNHFDKLIDNILVSFNFDVDYEDAKQECFLLVFKILKNFNPENGKAFNYFTTVIINNLRLIYSKNKTYRKKLETYFRRNEQLKDLLD